MGTDLLSAATAGAVAALVLHIFYRSVQHRWPENYSTLSGVLESYVSGGLLRYLAFRVVPIYLAGVFLAVTAARLDLSTSLAVAVMTFLHIATTYGRATLALLRPDNAEPQAATLLVYYLASAVLVLVAGGVARLTFNAWSEFIPVPSDIVLALWTGLFAAVLAAYIQSLHGTAPTEEALVAQAERDMGSDLWDYAERAAWKHDCDPDFIRAILVTEVMQRPAWFRRLERIKGKVIPAGTYGVGQVASPHPLTDEQSIDAIAEFYAGYYPERAEGGWLKTERLAAKVERHNRKQAFVDVVRAVYDYLQPTASWASPVTARDQRPVIAVSDVKREGEEWLISGTAVAYEGNLLYNADEGRPPAFGGFIQVSTGAPRRGTWSVRLPLAVRRLWIREENADDAVSKEDPDRTAFLELDSF